MVQRGTTHNKTVSYSFDTAGAEALRDLLHHSLRDAGKETSVWTLELAADVAFERGLTAWRVSGETVRATLARMGVRTALGAQKGWGEAGPGTQSSACGGGGWGYHEVLR